MTTTTLKKEIAKALVGINDQSFLEGLYTIINAHAEKTEFEISEKEWQLIEARKRDFKAGKIKGMTVAEVRKQVMKEMTR